MLSGTEKNPNPCEVSLGKYLKALARPSKGYIQLRNGQLVRKETLARIINAGKPPVSPHIDETIPND